MRLMIALLLGLAGVTLDDADPVKKDPQPKDFVGKWSGKWDDTWAVQFTVTQDPKTDQLSLVYEWEESLGKPLRRNRPAVARIENDALKCGKLEITLADKDPDKAKAKGNFKTPRTAALTREKPESK